MYNKLTAFARRKTLSTETVSMLTERFLDGATTPAEERALYTFYRRSPEGSLPAELEQYRPMMQWYAGLGSRQARRPVWRYAGIAVAVTVIAGAAVTVLNSPKTEGNGLYACYQGSYVVRDGRKTTDLGQIHATLAHAEYTADSLWAVAERQAHEIEIDPAENMVDVALSNIADPELATSLRCDLLGIDYDEI